MFNRRLKVSLLFPALFISFVTLSSPAQLQETADEPAEPATTPMPEPAPAPEPEPTPPPPEPASAPASEGQSPAIVYLAPSAQPEIVPEEDPLVNLRKKPKKIRPIEGQEPPPGYVEIEKRRMGLIIAGTAVFGGFYIASVTLSTANRLLLIPIAGPAIAGFSYESDSEFTDATDAEYTARLFGTLDTLFQTAGVTLFIIGMASKKKKLWLRQDIAGVSFQLTPTVVAERDPGLGILGTF